jgi:hypothetical protein
MRITWCAIRSFFDRDDQGAMPLRVHLWKKILTWVKPTQRHHFAMLSVTIECNFLCRRETGFEFATCAKTSIT